MRNSKMLGLLIVAAMALAAFVGTASAAAESRFTAGKAGSGIAETTIKNHVLSITGNTVECKNIVLGGTTPGTSFQELILSPSYKECTAFGFAGATVDTNGCELRISATTQFGNEHGLLEIDGCGSGNTEDVMKGIQITVKVPLIAECIVDIPEQIIFAAVHYTNGEGDMKASITGNLITSTVTKSTGLCPLTVGTHSNTNYKGESTLSAEGSTLQWDAT